ncbi:hypothetical protein L226DRAFT_96508 [Lentinus tigrinus ALCF2SS1-7]|uniref:uncharacterized protein n=1 Tax=Lentinus tigrinus ALCF2SS1-7 TaxID=1328758 RepID=UPI001166108D|nr:hypothetical protein L226DRAFT_96508 [Lentinus tigrinus ALCF2SS1-7]
MPGNRCSKCAAAGLDCQYSPVTKTSGRPTRRYVEALEDRLKRMEGLVKKLYSDAQGAEHPHSDSSESDPRQSPVGASVGAMTVLNSSSSPEHTTTSLYPPSLHRLTEHDSDELESSEDEVDIPMGSTLGYHGKSSNKDLIVTVMDLKKGDLKGLKRKLASKYHKPCIPQHFAFELPMAMNDHEVPHTGFPEPDLMSRLIDAYFEHFNTYLPLLHRPTFEHDIKRNLHFRDRSFGTVVLLVCAIGSTWTQDPRIRAYEPGFGRGWEWFDQVGHEQWSLLTSPKLHDLQACALTAAYITSSNLPQSNWMVLTLGIRMAVDAGAHRKKTYGTIPTIEQEQWKRAFWVLVAMDRMTSFNLGRPCAIHDEDFDLDPMIECDDEYWTNPNPALAFKQPAGRPSKIAFANCFIRLLMILAFASRTIYTTNKSKLILGFHGVEWKQNIVAEIDSGLNKWRDSVPAHLRWDPDRKDLTFFNQSAFLYSHFYQFQIFVHRQFIPSPRRSPSSHQLPSMTICVSAARACMEVIETQWRRTGESNCALTPLHLPLFTTAIVLLMNLWGGKLSDRETETLVADIKKCVDIFKELEVDNQAARKVRALLSAMMTITPSKSSPDTTDVKATPSDLGDLVTVAMENLRISISGDPQIEDDQFAEFVCTVNARKKKSASPPSDSTPSPFATASSSTATPVFSEMSAFYDSPQKDPLLPSATISEEHTNPTPFAQQQADPTLFLPSSYRDETRATSVFAPASTSTALHESLSIRGPDGNMDFAMSCGDSLFETLVECLQNGDGASAGPQLQSDPLQPPQPRMATEGAGTMANPDIDFSSWLEGELADVPWAMPNALSPTSPECGIDWNTYLQMMGPLPGGDTAAHPEF